MSDCLIPGCNGRWHQDGSCVVELPDVEFDGPGVVLSTELVSDDGEAPRVVAMAFNMHSLETRREMADQRSATEFAAQLRRLADAVDTAAGLLPRTEAAR